MESSLEILYSKERHFAKWSKFMGLKSGWEMLTCHDRDK